MSARKITIRSEGLTLPKVIWREFKRQPTGYLEAVLDANPGLADVAHSLPVGREIKLPVPTLLESKARSDVVRLWD
jgi:phage tail protein X